MTIHYFESGQIDFERTIRGYAAEMDMEFRDAVSWLSKRPSLSVAGNFLGMEHASGDVLRQLGKFLDKHGYTVPKLSGDLSNKEKGLPGGAGVKQREREEKANGEVAVSRLSTVEQEQYRVVAKGKPTEKPPVIVGQGLQRRNEGESTVGTMTLTREEYLAERKAGKSNPDIARAQGITGPALVYHLNKWGLKDSGSVEKELAKLGAKEAVTQVEQPAAIDVSLKVTTTEVAATVEPPTRNLEELIPRTDETLPVMSGTNTSSQQTHAQPVDKVDSVMDHPPEAPTDYIMIRVPVRFDGWESYKGKLPVDRDRLITEGTVSIQYAAAWAYREMLDLFGDGATEKRFADLGTFNLERDLITTIRDRDKTIAEKEDSRQSWRAIAQFRDERIQTLQQQNQLMLSALEELDRENPMIVDCSECGSQQDIHYHGKDCVYKYSGADHCNGTYSTVADGGVGKWARDTLAKVSGTEAPHEPSETL